MASIDQSEIMKMMEQQERARHLQMERTSGTGLFGLDQATITQENPKDKNLLLLEDVE